MKAHQTKAQKGKARASELKDISKNESADSLAVRGAAKHQVSDELMGKKQHMMEIGRDIQEYLIMVVKIRGRELDKLGIGKEKFESRNAKLKQLEEKDGEEEGDNNMGSDTMTMTQEEKEDILLMDRKKAFPNYWWEPRVEEKEEFEPLIEARVEQIKVTKENWAWYFPYAMVEPLMWYWRTAQWDVGDEYIIRQKKEKDPGAEWTPWLIVAIDFYYSTGVEVCKADEHMADRKIRQIADYFRSASMQIWQLMGNRKAVTTKPAVKALGNLQMVNLPAMKNKMKARNPEMVNRTLHKIAIEAIKKGMRCENGHSMQFTMEWPAMGILSWKEARKEGIMLKRMRGKQKPPEGREKERTVREKNQALKPVQVNIVKMQGRLKPSHKSIRGEIEWSKEEKKVLEKCDYDRVVRQRQEKILLFNRRAKEDDFHEYLPITTPTQVKLTCRLCKNVIDCSAGGKGGVVRGFNADRMKKKCAENGNSAEKAKKDRLAVYRNRTYKEWNEKHKNDEKTHSFYLVDGETCDTIACTKEGCKLNQQAAFWPKETNMGLATWLRTTDKEFLVCGGKPVDHSGGKNYLKIALPARLRGGNPLQGS